MRQVTIFCDKCKKEVPSTDNIKIVSISIKIDVHKSFDRQFELCESCANDLRQLIAKEYSHG